MSLLPIQTLAKVGCATSARWTWLIPPRNNSVRALAAGPTAASGSYDVAPGTATLLMISVNRLGLRSKQVAAVGGGAPVGKPVVTSAPVTKFAIGGGQPGIVKLG